MNEILFSLLRTSIWGEEKYPLQIPQDSVDWPAIYKELRQQTVQYLTLEYLCGLDPEHKVSYLKAISQSMSRFYTVMSEQKKLYQLFLKEKIPFVILKGSAAACYYPHPEYRCTGDIDILVKPEDYSSAYLLMKENGFLAQEENTEVIRHVHFTKNGVLYELHRYFSLFHEEEQAGILEEMLFAAIDQAKIVSLSEYEFPMLQELENGLVLLTHIAQHLENGLGLRQMVDWMMYVDHRLDDSFWEKEFEKKADSLGLKTLALTVTKMCQLYLGLSDKITWCAQAEEALCHELMELTLQRGNFGRKLSRDELRSQNTLLAFRGIKQFFSRLQWRGCKNWKLLEKWPALKPFAWIYQLCRYIYRGLKREHPFRQLAEDIKSSRKNDDIFDRLGISRSGDGIWTPDGTKW